MVVHEDGSGAAWLRGQRGRDLIVTMDDATSTIYSAFLVEEEGTASTFRALLEVFTAHGLPSSLYTDRGSHYFYTAKAGEAVDRERLTQVGRALDRLGIEHIAAYSPEARGRSERMFGTLQDRLIKELAKAGVTDMAAANAWFRDVYLPAHNARFARPAAVAESAFVRIADPAALTETLCVQEDRVVDRANTVSWGRLKLQLPQSPLRAHFVKARVRVHEYPDGALAVFHGPHCIARYSARGEEISEVPTCASSDTMLAAVKDAARRLRRWPKRAILDGGCARRHWADAGRDEETALRSNKETELKKAGKRGSSRDLAQP